MKVARLLTPSTRDKLRRGLAEARLGRWARRRRRWALGIRNYPRPTTVVVLTLAEAALHAQRPSGLVHHDDGMRTVGLARAAQVFDLVARAKYSITRHGSFRIEHCAFCIEHCALRRKSAT
jgi:hypothetical protein